MTTTEIEREDQDDIVDEVTEEALRLPTPRELIEGVEGELEAELEAEDEALEEAMDEAIEEAVEEAAAQGGADSMGEDDAYDDSHFDETRGEMLGSSDESEDAPAPRDEAAPARARTQRSSALLFVAAVATVGAFLAGFLVAGAAVEALPVAALAVLLTVLPGGYVAGQLRRSSRALERGAAAQSDGASGMETDETWTAGDRERHLLHSRDETVREVLGRVGGRLEAELAEREEKFRKATSLDLEKIRVFFESLLEKHVHRINRELRDKEQQLEELKARYAGVESSPPAGDTRASKGGDAASDEALEDAQEEIASLRAEVERLVEELEDARSSEARKRAEIQVLEERLEEQRDRAGADASSASESVAASDGEFEELRERLESLEDELESSRARVEELTALLDSATAADEPAAAGDLDVASDIDAIDGSTAPAGQPRQRFFEQVSRHLQNHAQLASKIVSEMAVDVSQSADEEIAEEVGAEVAELKSHIESVQRLVRQVVDLERLSTGAWKAVYTEVNVREVLRRVADQLRDVSKSRGVKIQTRVAKEVQALSLDQTALSRAVRELVGNAVAYTDNGGFVYVSAGIDESGDGGAKRLSIRVKDGGKGIAEKDRERIFNAFEQAEKPRFSLVGAGAGLGLALARGYATQLGGTLELESEAGRGSTFSLIVPAR